MRVFAWRCVGFLASALCFASYASAGTLLFGTPANLGKPDASATISAITYDGSVLHVEGFVDTIRTTGGDLLDNGGGTLTIDMAVDGSGVANISSPLNSLAVTYDDGSINDYFISSDLLDFGFGGTFLNGRFDFEFVQQSGIGVPAGTVLGAVVYAKGGANTPIDFSAPFSLTGLSNADVGVVPTPRAAVAGMALLSVLAVARVARRRRIA